MRFFIFAAGFAMMTACSPPSTETPATEGTPAAPMALTVSLSRATESGPGESLGNVLITGGAGGAVFAIDLQGLPAGQHGFHIHQTGDCSAAMDHGAMAPAHAAGGHWDPQNTGRHAGPDGDGHLGDLPRLEAGADGRISTTVTAARIADIAQLRGHALMIHAGGDTYSDTPELGGGGARIACGVIG
jgi:Cu-Zn family superoxide dismutase